MKNIPYIAGHRVDTLSPFRTPDFPRRAGLEDGSGLRCLGVFRLMDHLKRNWIQPNPRHPTNSPEAWVANLIDALLEEQDIHPVQAPTEIRLKRLLGRLSPPFGADSPVWAMALGPEAWQSTGAAKEPDRRALCGNWPRLTLEQGLVMLARTSGGHYHATREIVFEPECWLETHVWFAPLAIPREATR